MQLINNVKAGISKSLVEVEIYLYN